MTLINKVVHKVENRQLKQLFSKIDTETNVVSYQIKIGNDIIGEYVEFKHALERFEDELSK